MPKPSICLALLASLSTACAAPAPRLPIERLAVTPALKEAPYSCGASALHAVLRYWGAYDGAESDLHERLGTRPKEGTDSKRMAALAREFGLEVELKENLTTADLRAALERGKTVILDLQAWGPPGTDYSTEWERGHYVVVVAMDRHYLYLADPNSGAYSFLPTRDLAARWHDYEGEGTSLWRNRGLGMMITGRRPPSLGPSSAVSILPLP
jgi:predicted double-glycine peptidase